MNGLKTVVIVLVTLIVVGLIGSLIFFRGTATGRELWNNWQYSLNKTDESTYENQKLVEDTCRAMIASYNSDKLVYEQYWDSTNEEQISWANNAKIKANQTASVYNNYVLQNSFVWEDNIPSDIYKTLPYID